MSIRKSVSMFMFGVFVTWALAGFGRPLVLEENQIEDPRLRSIIVDLVDNSNGWLEFGINVNMTGVSHTFNTTDTQETIDITALGLEYIPSNFIQYGSSNGAYAYPTNTASWTSTSITAGSTRAGTITIVPFAAGPQ